ncbi:hypothetical protein PybrP1_005864 [[Pythium] brassicae (nom. inval.)]|nr:hypothetical protein PybrP1_005864 [[Pythium] brassicae (nom. inval.)]
MAAPDAPASPPLHAAVNSTYQPKRQTFSRFFRRYPYGERRSRAVAPADARASHPLSRRRHAGTSEFGRMRDGSVLGLRADQRLRLHIGEFMRQLYVELFFVMIVLAYGIFVVVQITMGDDALVTYKSAIDLTDVTVGSILLLEIALKVFAYGAQYLRNGWNLFDALVIVASFVLGLLAAMGTTSALIVKILRLRVILRVLRVLVVFERVKSRSKAMHFVHKGPITSPVEHVLRVLHELRSHPALRSSLRAQIEFAIDVIKNNRLYEANGELIGAEVDDDTQNWLRGEVLKVNDTAKVLPDATDDVPPAPADASANNGFGGGGGGATSGRPGSDSGDTPTAHSMTARRSVTMKELLPPLDVASEFELQNLLRDVNSWAFDIFRVHVVSGGNALCHLGYHLLHELAASHLQVEQATLVNFLLEIQRGYVATNAYHNSIHAADVMQTVNYFLIQPELAPFLRPLDRALALLAAGIHDFKHDGFNNSFHILTGSEIALRYNDHAVLENFHVAQSFLVMKAAACNVLGKLSAEDFKYSREMLIQMVLATDMAKHFEDVALFKANILPAGPDEDLVIKNVGDKKLLLKMILHTCDVSNPAKDRELMLKWTERVVEEFFVQGDLEKQLALAVSPFMDRDTIVLKKMQVGFADFIVAPLFSVWAQILGNVNAVGYKTLLANREFWSSLADEFKPYMIKDVLRDLSHRKRMSQASIASVASTNDDAAATHSTSRARRSVANLVLATDTGGDS